MASSNKALDTFFDHATARELHEFPTSWNWDSGTDRIEQLIEHPKCDAGTALKTYWLFQPQYYLAFADPSEVPDYQRDDFELMQRLLSAYMNGEFATAQMPYRPPRKPKQPEQTWKRSIPDKMYQPVGPQSFWSRIRSLTGV